MANEENNDPASGLPKPVKPSPSPVRSEYDRDDEELILPDPAAAEEPYVQEYPESEIDIQIYEQNDDPDDQN